MKVFLGIIATAAIFFLLGSIGALEQDWISLRQGLIQMAVSLLVAWGSISLCKYAD